MGLDTGVHSLQVIVAIAFEQIFGQRSQRSENVSGNG